MGRPNRNPRRKWPVKTVPDGGQRQFAAGSYGSLRQELLADELLRAARQDAAVSASRKDPDRIVRSGGRPNFVFGRIESAPKTSPLWCGA